MKMISYVVTFLIISSLVTFSYCIDYSGDSNTTKSLIQTMNNGNEDVDNRVHAINLLGESGSQEAVYPLIQIVENKDKEDRMVVMAAILALGDIGNTTSISTLEPLMKDSDNLFRHCAIYSVEQLDDNAGYVAAYGKFPRPGTEEYVAYFNNASEIRSALKETLNPYEDGGQI